MRILWNYEKKYKDMENEKKLMEVLGSIVDELSAVRRICADVERRMSIADTKYHDGMGIETLGLSQRAVNALAHEGISTLGQLKNVDMMSLRGSRGIGNKTYAEIADCKYNMLK